jgi:hypothetical protein
MGIGAIGMVRLSGDKAVDMTTRIFRAHDQTCLAHFKTHTLKYGHIVKDSQPIDEVLLPLPAIVIMICFPPDILDPSPLWRTDGWRRSKL